MARALRMKMLLVELNKDKFSENVNKSSKWHSVKTFIEHEALVN